MPPYQTGFGADGIRQLLQVDQPVLLDRQVCDLKSALLQVAARVQHTFVVRLEEERKGAQQLSAASSKGSPDVWQGSTTHLVARLWRKEGEER